MKLWKKNPAKPVPAEVSKAVEKAEAVVAKKKPAKELTIFAYGFEKAGFRVPTEVVPLEGVGQLLFVRQNEPVKLDDSDGVIVPSGIFESFELKEGWNSSYWEVYCDKDLLIEKEKQVRNLLMDRKWVCFLVGEIKDRLGRHRDKDVSDTDLCKRILNAFRVGRETFGDAVQTVTSKCSEFDSFIREYGVAKTVLEPVEGDDFNTLASVGKYVVGAEFLRRAFFLPFHTTRTDATNTALLATQVARAVLEYIERRKEEVPGWADKFEFASEQALRSEFSILREKTEKVTADIERWREYKSILVTSGDVLRDRLVQILRQYFGLTVDPTDEFKEDAKVLDAEGKTLVLVECKGTNKGIKREYIGQVNFHRDRAGLDQSLPGILFINDNNTEIDLAKRHDEPVPVDQVKYAKSLNVLVVRTIDLLFLMRQLEKVDTPKRADAFMSLVRSGGGLLKTTEGTCEIVTS